MFTLELDDPHDTLTVNAFCRMVEIHISWESQVIVAIYNCWRSQSAFEAKKSPFYQLKVELPADDGGAAFLAGDQSGYAFKAALNAFIITHKLPNAIPVTPGS